MSAEMEINSIVEKIAENIPVSEYDVEHEEGNQKGEGYMGKIYFVKIKSKKNEKNYNVVIKKAFNNEKLRRDMPIRYVFLNEVFFYKELYPVLQEVQVNLNLPEFKNVAKCLYTNLESDNEYLALENLKPSGFEMFPKEKIIPFDHFEFIFKAYANLHATSFIFHKTQPKKFTQVTLNIVEIYPTFFNNTDFLVLWRDMLKKTRNLLIPGKDDNVIKAFDEIYSKDPLNIFKDSWIYKGQHPVINHGDCWSNNIMLKYDNKRDLTDLKIIDWQMLEIGSPAHDLSYCLYSGASKETFDKLEDLLKIYYKTFSDILKKANLDPEQVYPYSVLKEEWKEYARYGWIMSLVIIRLKLMKQEDKVDLMDMCDVEDKAEARKKFLGGTLSVENDSRVRDLILHVYEIGAL